MKLHIETKYMTFKEEDDLIEHEIILGIKNEEFYGYDKMIELPDDDEFIKNTYKINYKKDYKGKNTIEIESRGFDIRECGTWWSFPLYEIEDDKIFNFNYKKYAYFNDTERRNRLAFKIKILYNPSAELKILRKTLKHIMDTLKIEYPDNFGKYNSKVKAIIAKHPK